MLAGNLAYGFSQWAILVVLARLGSPEIVGRFAIAMAVATPVMMFAGMQLRQIQATDTNRNHQFSDYGSTRILTSFLGIAIVMLCAWGSGFDGPTVGVIAMLALWRAIELISDICHGQFQQDDRLDLIGQSKLIRSTLFAVLVMGSLSQTDNLSIAVSTLPIGSLFMLLTYDLWFLRDMLRKHGETLFQFRPHWKTISSLIWKSFPLGLLIGVVSLETNAPRYVLHGVGGERVLGIFAALGYTTIAVQAVVIAVNQAALTPLARAWRGGDRRTFHARFRKLLTFGVALGVAGIFGGLLLGKPFLTFAFGPAYAEHNRAFVILIAAFGCQAFAQTFQTAARSVQQNWWPLATRLVGFAILGLACWLLIPGRGLEGAAIAVLTGAAAGAVLFMIAGSIAISRIRFEDGNA